MTENEILRDVIGLVAFSDLVNGAYGQFFNNAFQENSLPHEMLDDHHLLLEQNTNPAMYMASRFNKQAQPFHQFLLQPFLANQPKTADEKDVWLLKCKQNLSAKIPNLHGLCSAILLRHIMGESIDLGPDNMLLVSHADALHIINIDMTDFRYARRHMFKDSANNQERLGWENTLKSNNPEDMMKFLFDSTVFSNRFVLNEDILPADLIVDVMKTIVEVLKSKISLSTVYAEVLSVRTWLQAQNLELAVASLKTATEEAYGALNPKVKPQRYYLERLIKHNKSFLNDCIQVAYDLRETNIVQLETATRLDRNSC